MKRILLYTLIVLLSLSYCNSRPTKINTTKPVIAGSITKIEMDLSAFGVESDDFPSITCYIDFSNDSCICKKSYYDPAYKSSTYKLSKAEIKKVLQLLQATDLKKLKTEYTVTRTDQPTSTTTIYTGQKKFTIKDYGLEGAYPLQELYKIVYKL